jgi:hypothetical protein
MLRIAHILTGWLLIFSISACSNFKPQPSGQAEVSTSADDSAENLQFLVGLPFIAAFGIITLPISIPLQLAQNQKDKKDRILFQASFSIVTEEGPGHQQQDKILNSISAADFKTKISVQATGLPNQIYFWPPSRSSSRIEVSLGAASKPDLLKAILAFKEAVIHYSKAHRLHTSFEGPKIIWGPGFLGFVSQLKAE